MIDIKSIRAKTGMSQSEFANSHNIPVATIRDWEQGRRTCPPYVVELLEFKVDYQLSSKTGGKE